MARKTKGTVLERTTKRGAVYALRFTALDARQYVTLGTAEEGWTRQRADDELAFVLGQVERGLWKAPQRALAAPPPEAPAIVTFGEYAAVWLEQQRQEGGRRGTGLTEAGYEDLSWRLRKHLLPVFARVPLDAITVDDVGRYRRAKVNERAICPSSINKTLATLTAILELAVENEVIGRNVAKVGKRRLPAAKPRRVYLDRADHIAALLDAAGELDGEATARLGQRRALMATLVFAGLRIGEALALRWRDVNLARGTLTVRAAKTDAGLRTVDLLPVLRDELLAYRAARPDAGRDDLVFGTDKGTRQGQSNVRRRVLAAAVTRANERLAVGEYDPLPEGLTPHALRRTFASLLFAIGEPPTRVMGQMGHTTAALTLGIYAREMDRRDGEPERLRALVEGVELAPDAATGQPVPNGHLGAPSA